MNRIIKLPDDWEKRIGEMLDFQIVDFLYGIIRNGTPIPDNATNGDVITEILKSSNDVHSIRYIGLAQEDTIYIEVGSNWWNAPYQKGGTKRKSCEYRHENGNCLKVGGFCTSVDNEHCMKGGKS